LRFLQYPFLFKLSPQLTNYLDIFFHTDLNNLLEKMVVFRILIDFLHFFEYFKDLFNRLMCNVKYDEFFFVMNFFVLYFSIFILSVKLLAWMLCPHYNVLQQANHKKWHHELEYVIIFRLLQVHHYSIIIL
jgi:hypothetical protein